MDFFQNHYFYFFLLFITIIFPLLASFESRIRYFQKWKKLFTAIFLMMLIFIPWDIYFSYNNIWHFSDDFTIGLDVFKLPIEEWLFFICIPFSCVFIYESLDYFSPLKKPFPYIGKITISLSVLLLIFAWIFYDQLYTNVCFSLSSFGLVVLSFQNEKWISSFFRWFLVCMIPFLLINGFLTGSFSDAIVTYNADHIIGFRIPFFNIPIEDCFYNLIMLLTTLFFYDKINRIVY